MAGYGSTPGDESRDVGTNPTDLALDLAGLNVDVVDIFSQPELASERAIEISLILGAGAAVSLRTPDTCNAEELDPSDPGEISRL